MFDSVFDVLVFIIMVALVGLSIFAYARKFLLSLKGRKAAMHELEAPIKKPTTKKTQVSVVSKRTDTVYSGSPRYPKHELKFFATFKVPSGKNVEYEIPEKLFGRLQAGQNGTLITVNGEFFDLDIG